MQPGSVEHRPAAIGRINQVLPDQVDLSVITSAAGSTDCSGIKYQQVDEYVEFNSKFCPKNWDYSLNVWHAKICQVGTNVDPELVEVLDW